MIDQKTIIQNIPFATSSISYAKLGKRHNDKVYDWYDKNNLRILIATDRISAFDKVLGTIPFSGVILNKLAEFWFNQTRDVIPNYMIGLIDPNVMLVSQFQPIPVEVIASSPRGLVKNQKLKKTIIIPLMRATTQVHNETITVSQILKQKLVSPKIWKQIEKTVPKLFQRGCQIYQKKGFILVSSKYQFGLDKNGKLILIGQLHTPDTSLLCLKKTYLEKSQKGQEIENYPIEPMITWFAQQGYRGHGKAPALPQDLIVKITTRHVEIYEKITGEKLTIDKTLPKERILENLSKLI